MAGFNHPLTYGIHEMAPDNPGQATEGLSFSETQDKPNAKKLKFISSVVQERQACLNWMTLLFFHGIRPMHDSFRRQDRRTLVLTDKGKSATK